jgi:hypothetical protein
MLVLVICSFFVGLLTVGSIFAIGFYVCTFFKPTTASYGNVAAALPALNRMKTSLRLAHLRGVSFPNSRTEEELDSAKAVVLRRPTNDSDVDVKNRMDSGGFVGLSGGMVAEESTSKGALSGGITMRPTEGKVAVEAVSLPLTEGTVEREVKREFPKTIPGEETRLAENGLGGELPSAEVKISGAGGRSVNDGEEVLSSELKEISSDSVSVVSADTSSPMEYGQDGLSVGYYQENDGSSEEVSVLTNSVHRDSTDIVADMNFDFGRDAIETAEENFIEGLDRKEFSFRKDALFQKYNEVSYGPNSRDKKLIDAKVYSWIYRFQINGVAPKGPKSCLIAEGRIFRLGDVVNPEFGLVWTDIDPKERTLLFVDSKGERYSFHY